jgi:putative sugar O-methyltransferase
MDAIVSAARDHFHSASRDPCERLPDAGPRWGTLAAWSRQQIETFETAKDAIHFAQSPLGHGGFEARLTGDALAAKAAEQETRLAATFPQLARHLASFVEPDVSEPASMMIYNGRRVSSPMFVHTQFFMDCVTRIPRLDNVCDIGGGFGAPARLFLTNSYKRPRIYALIDLPESLFFAECYLRATLGGDRVHYVDGALGELPEWSAVLCPITRIAALRPILFDLVTNTLSMAEMSDAYVAFYCDWLAAQPANHFYSFNRFLSPHHGESGNLFAPRLPPDWTIISSIFEPGVPNSFLQLLATRTSSRADAAPVIGRPLAPAATYALLHAASNSDDTGFLLQLATAMAVDFKPSPKELLFLCHRIEAIEQARPVLPPAELARVAEIRASVERSHAGIERARVPPHLANMQRDLYPIGPT